MYFEVYFDNPGFIFGQLYPPWIYPCLSLTYPWAFCTILG